MRIAAFKPWVILILLLPSVIIGWTRLSLETDILATLPQDTPQVRGLQLLRDGFEGGSDLIITVESATAEAAEGAAKTIASLLAERTDLVRDVRHSSSLEEEADTGSALIAWMIQNSAPEKLQAFRSHLEADGAATQILNSLNTAAESPDIQKVQLAGYDPIGLLDIIDPDALMALNESMFNLTSEDGTFRLLLVTPATEVGNYKSAAAWLDQIKSLLDAALTGQNASLRYTGEPAFQAEIGAGIEKDMTSTIGLTEGLIALLFWLLFRRLKPLIWIQGLLLLSMFVTLGLGGLLLGRLSIISLGFAAIVLGIIVDYAVLILQEARLHPSFDPTALRKRAAPGIIAGACTTATVFASLSFSSLPGLAEMGLLVALGVLVGLCVMLAFAPNWAANSLPSRSEIPMAKENSGGLAALLGTVLLIGGMIATFAIKGLPPMQTDAGALRPTQSLSMDALQRMQERLGKQQQTTLPIIITGAESTLRTQSQTLTHRLAEGVRSGVLKNFALPTILISDPAAQLSNKPHIEWILGQRVQFEKALDQAGFTEDAMRLLRGVCSAWQPTLLTWPQNESTSAAAPILQRLLATGTRAQKAGLTAGEGIALASVGITGAPSQPDPAALDRLQNFLSQTPSAQIAGWETLGNTLSKLAREDLNQQLLPILAIIAFTLIATFRNVKDLLLSVLLLTTGLGALAATMTLLGQSWNLASLAAIPLLLGTGIDYGIHVLLALKRSENAIHLVQMTTGKAVFFSGMTTVIAFASLVFSNNSGLSRLGLACCIGTLWILLITLWLLPHWRAWLHASPKARP